MSNDSYQFRTHAQLEEEGWTREGTDWIRDEKGKLEWRVPLYEAKMIHHYDHRWATYAGGSADDEEGARDCTLSEKQDPNYEPTPRYWVPEEDVHLRAARVPASLKRACRDQNEDRCLKALAEWLVGYYLLAEGRNAKESEVVQVLGKNRSWRTILGVSVEKFILTPKVQSTGQDCQRATPLTAEDLVFLKQAPEDGLELTAALLERKQPRWLMGWRDICRATDERTVIASVFPRVGAGNKVLLMYPQASPSHCAVLLGGLSSLAFDFQARQKSGGTSLNYYTMKQLPFVAPEEFSKNELAFVVERVLPLTFTSNSTRYWAEHLGYSGAPFAWDLPRRALLRSELYAFYGKKFGLSVEDLQYVLDPASIRGETYPSETFRVLKKKEESRYGEYRTRRLVLEAWDRLGNI